MGSTLRSFEQLLFCVSGSRAVDTEPYADARVRSPRSRANTRAPLAGMLRVAEYGCPPKGPPSELIPDGLPAAFELYPPAAGMLS